MTSAGTDTPRTVGVGAGGYLVRVGWMLFGTLFSCALPCGIRRRRSQRVARGTGGLP
jgi:hypothetical protein